MPIAGMGRSKSSGSGSMLAAGDISGYSSSVAAVRPRLPAIAATDRRRPPPPAMSVETSNRRRRPACTDPGAARSRSPPHRPRAGGRPARAGCGARARQPRPAQLGAITERAIRDDVVRERAPFGELAVGVDVDPFGQPLVHPARRALGKQLVDLRQRRHTTQRWLGVCTPPTAIPAPPYEERTKRFWDFGDRVHPAEWRPSPRCARRILCRAAS